jgi:hypothetical protein
VVIVHTTVWIDYLRGTQNPETQWLHRELDRRRLGLTDLILCEVMQGIQNQNKFIQAQAALLKFQVFETGGRDLAIAAAQNYRNLRESGYTVRRTIDCLIATFCLQGEHQLLHCDRDFDPFEKALGLQVVDPSG